MKIRDREVDISWSNRRFNVMFTKPKILLGKSWPLKHLKLRHIVEMFRYSFISYERLNREFTGQCQLDTQAGQPHQEEGNQ